MPAVCVALLLITYYLTLLLITYCLLLITYVVWRRRLHARGACCSLAYYLLPNTYYLLLITYVVNEVTHYLALIDTSLLVVAAVMCYLFPIYLF